MLLVAIVVPAIGLASSSSTVGSPSVSSATRLVAFRGHFGGSHVGITGRRSGGGGLFGGRGGRSHHLLRHVAHALIFASILHLLFGHGGLSILFWLLVIGIVWHLIRRRRRRRRYAYG